MPGYGAWTIENSPASNPVTLEGDVGEGNTFQSLGCTNVENARLRIYNYGENIVHDLPFDSFTDLNQQTITVTVTVPEGSYDSNFIWGVNFGFCGQTDFPLPQNPWIVENAEVEVGDAWITALPIVLVGTIGLMLGLWNSVLKRL